MNGRNFWLATIISMVLGIVLMAVANVTYSVTAEPTLLRVGQVGGLLVVIGAAGHTGWLFSR